MPRAGHVKVPCKAGTARKVGSQHGPEASVEVQANKTLMRVHPSQ